MKGEVLSVLRRVDVGGCEVSQIGTTGWGHCSGLLPACLVENELSRDEMR